MSSEQDAEHGARVLELARRLMSTKGYGWSKAIDRAAEYAAPPTPTAKKKKK